MFGRFKKLFGLQTKEKESTQQEKDYKVDAFEDDGLFEDAKESQEDSQIQDIGKGHPSGAENVTQYITAKYATIGGHIVSNENGKVDSSNESSSESEVDDSYPDEDNINRDEFSLPTNGFAASSTKDTDDLDECLEEIKFWLEDPNLHVNCNGYLQKLCDCVHGRYIIEGCYDFWVRILKRNRTLSDFFVRLKDMENSHKECNFSTIRLYIIRLTRPAGVKNFIESNILKPWLEDTSSKKEWPHGEISNLASFIAVLKKEVLPYLSRYESDHDLDQESERERFELFITNYIADATKLMLDGLQKSKLKEEKVFANIMIMRLHFNLESCVFEIPITKAKLEEFISSVEDKYNFFSCQMDINRQQYIIQEAIDTVCNFTSTRNREKNFNILLQPLMNEFDKSIASVFSFYTTSGAIDFDAFSQGLQQLHNKKDNQMKDIDLTNLAKSLNLQKELDREDINLNSDQELQDVNCDILRTFGLERYFPSKIEVQQVMKIDKEFSIENISDIPWIVLKKLIMLDHRGRDEVLSTYRNKSLNEGPTFSGDLDELVGDVVGNTIPDYNPLDVFVAIFCCCSNMLKQILVEKMFLCQLGIPFLYKPLLSENFQFSLWPIRALQSEGEYCPLVSTVTRVISFVRFNRPFYSKSELLSNVLSNGGYKNTFHHHNCFLGGTKKQLADGLVEASWYMSSNRDKEIVTKNVTCLNLRGNALEHQKQLLFLKEISDAIFILLNIKDICDPSCKEKILQLYTSNAMVVLTLYHNSEDGDYQSLLKSFRDEIEIQKYKERTKVVMISLNGKCTAEATLKQQIKTHIKSCVDRFPGKRLTELVGVAKSLNINIDENRKDILLGKKMAAEIISSMEPDLDNEKIRELHFPLQGSLWKKLSKCIKKLSKVKVKKSSGSRERLLEEISKIRMAQLQQCQNLSPVIQRFIGTLVAYQDQRDILSYFIKWLSILLKERTLNHATTENSPHSQMSLIGIEHFIRETGLIYEAVLSLSEDLSNEIVQLCDRLPTIVAKLILNGQAVEVMDGDNSNIALGWMKAIYSSIAQLTNNARILIVSVTGVQSAGKSTLVNAMFGLRFNVSSGRCTKGVYMEMIPVETKQCSNGFEYVIVLDCEGLRSQETSATTYDNDNRLATFIIGMSDICLINIKGENYAEMGDVLQVVVHAFFRLKSANKSLKLHQSCLFIHQNVSSEDADEQNKSSKTTFIETLDKITQIAAEQDGYLETTEFSKMIDFDHQKHCWYFKDFWHGNPPMAAVNYAYSENVNAVRQYMHSELIKNRRYFTITDLTEHMEDLWNGILTDDFIFSFRSSIQIKAYSVLESNFNEIKWNLEKYLFDLIQKEANEKIRWHSTVEKNRANIEETRNGLHRKIKELTRQSKGLLEEFIEGSDEFREIFLTWKPSKMSTLSKLGDQFLEKADLQLNEKQKQMKLDIKKREMKNKLNDQVKSTAKAFYESNPKPTDQELDTGFEDNWTDILQQWAHEKLGCSPQIEDQIKEKLFSHFTGKELILENETKKHSWKKSETFTKLEGSITVEDIEKVHINIKHQLIPWRKLKSRSQCNLETVDLTEKILRRVDAYLEDLDHIDAKYDDSQINELLRFVDDEIQNHNKKYAEQRKFTILSLYKVKLCVHICRFAVHKFQSMNDKYEEKHNTLAWCISQKPTAEKLFKFIVQRESEEQFAASALCDLIENALFREVIKKLRQRMEMHVCKQFENSKSILIKEIMFHLLKNIQDYEKYLNDPYLYSQNWITSFMKITLLEERENRHSIFSQIVLEIVAENISAIENSVLSATLELDRQPYGTTNRWVQHFKHGIKEHLQFTDEALKDVTLIKIHNFQRFQTKILKYLEELKQKLEKVICHAYDSCIYQETNLYETVTKKLWGCPEFCPFCGEPCKYTDPNHVKQGINHSCIQHRPLGLNGIHEYDSRQGKNLLIIDPCYVLVRSSRKFNCEWCAYDCQMSENTPHSKTQDHDFIAYRSFFPTWEVQASTKIEYYQYWCYVIANYAFIFKNKYGFDIIVPSSWRKIKESKAKDSLLRSLRLK